MRKEKVSFIVSAKMKIVAALVLFVACVGAVEEYDCRYGGESYWCSRLDIAKKCEKVDHCLNAVWKKLDLSGRVDSTACEYCEQVVGEAREMLNNSTEAAVTQFLDASCELCPEPVACRKEINENIDELFKLLRSYLDPKVVCSSLGFCPGLEHLVYHPKDKTELHQVPLLKSNRNVKKNSSGDVCKDCKAFVGDLVASIDSKATEDEIEGLLKQQICANLGPLADDCNTAVDTYIPEILEMLAGSVNPEEVCQALLVCPGDRFILQKMRLQKTRMSKAKNGESESCAICEMAFQELKSLVTDTTYQQDVENFLKKNLCPRLGSDEQACKDDIDEYGALFFELVKSEMDPSAICKALTLCHSQKQQDKTNNLKVGVECVICEFIMKELEQQLADNATEAEIIKALDTVCSLLPDTLSQQCKSFVETYGKAILILLKETLDPKEVCTTLGLCQGVGKPVKQKQAVGDEMCGVCETIIQYLDSLLSDNATVAEIEAALDKICNYIPETLRAECNDFVEKYGPMIVQLILEAADPETVCKELGLCSAAKFPVTHPVIVADSVQLLGTDECTHGPAFWCASYENAKKCKATKHCIAKVWRNGVPRL